MTNKNDNIVSINQMHGRPLNIIVKPKNCNARNNSKHISATDMQKISTKYGLTQNVTLGIASDLRAITKNRKIFAPNLKQSLSDSIHSLDPFFDVKVYKFKKSVLKETEKDNEISKESAEAKSELETPTKLKTAKFHKNLKRIKKIS